MTSHSGDDDRGGAADRADTDRAGAGANPP